MSRPVGRPAPIRPRGAFDLVPRSQTSRAGSLYPSSNGAAASPAGYTLGGAASAAASRSEQQRENELKIEKHKEKEREKYLIKLQEKIKRHSHLNTAPGQSLNDLDAPSSSLLTVRELQHITYTEAAESHKMNESEVQEKLTQKKMAKLQEKIKRHPYLNTSPGQRLNQDVPLASLPAETLEPVDKDREMREMRNRLQEKYNSSLKKHPQSS
ncbi:uncharacterized protein LOC113205160 isoform X2 [Frankliniella occidentalis]|uniref:Uncharacterized protein LOC113205160 isoform X2 n=1 Tax=Frankliniella occidentalis TaxID=133901 RepID=A0A6J1S5H1_FRAOC|nr:uncharacterized protein LOC113205160 isoform X2 [Frankliniella occidentalis]